MPSSARRRYIREPVAWRAPSSRRFRPVAANDNDSDARPVPRDPTRPSPWVGLLAAGALAILLVAMMTGAL